MSGLVHREVCRLQTRSAEAFGSLALGGCPYAKSSAPAITMTLLSPLLLASNDMTKPQEHLCADLKSGLGWSIRLERRSSLVSATDALGICRERICHHVSLSMEVHDATSDADAVASYPRRHRHPTAVHAPRVDVGKASGIGRPERFRSPPRIGSRPVSHHPEVRGRQHRLGRAVGRDHKRGNHVTRLILERILVVLRVTWMIAMGGSGNVLRGLSREGLRRLHRPPRRPGLAG